MNTVLSMFRRLVPELVDVARTRFEMLEAVALMAPVGRRALAGHLDLPERTVRGEAERLKELGLIRFAPDGMYLTDEGTEVLGDLRARLDLLFAEPLADRIRQETGITSVMVVSGDSAVDEISRRALYRKAVQYLTSVLRDGMTLAVVGGSTMAGVAAQTQTDGQGLPNLMVVPARGGLGAGRAGFAGGLAGVLAGAGLAAPSFSSDCTSGFFGLMGLAWPRCSTISAADGTACTGSTWPMRRSIMSSPSRFRTPV